MNEVVGGGGGKRERRAGRKIASDAVGVGNEERPRRLGLYWWRGADQLIQIAKHRGWISKKA